MKNIAQLIEGTQNILHQLWEKNQHVQQVNQTLMLTLPSPLSKHCRVVNLREQTAVIYADSAAWATRLRYLIPDILQAWQQQTSEITKIEIRVHLEAIEPTTAPNTLSPEPLMFPPTLTVTSPPETTPLPPIISQARINKRRPYPLTQNAADHLRHTADSTTHPRLKAVLLRLASRSEADKD